MSNAASFVQIQLSNPHNLLSNSTTKINRATYIRLNDSSTGSSSGGRAIEKANFVSSLGLQQGETDEVLKTLAPEGAPASSSLPRDMTFWSLLRQFEGTPLASGLPPTSAFTDIAANDLIAFGNGLITVRKQIVERLQASSGGTGVDLGNALIRLNTAQVMGSTFGKNMVTQPAGWLNLERLEMTPVGIERGGLVATVPLAPMETTFVTQKEWSVTTQEFTSIVTDSLDNYSETGVTENTQLTQATTSQVAHANQFNVTASASGGIGFVSGSAATSFGSQDSNSNSATASRQNSIQTTRLASSRVKQSHKMSISTTSVQGTSDATTRKLQNPSPTDPMRIDYYSMMRKWYVALYRYGLRLTYDITVPEPGATLREIYAKLQILQNLSSQTFVFPITHGEITVEVKPGDSEPYYLVLADKYGVDVSAPPRGPNSAIHQGGAPIIVPTGGIDFSKTDQLKPVTFNVPSGYWISAVIYTQYLGNSTPPSINPLGTGLN